MRRLILSALIVLLLGGVLAAAHGPAVKDNSVLVIHIKGDLAERPSSFLARLISGDRPTLLDTLMNIRKAAEDKRIVGLVLQISDAKMPWSRIQDLREALQKYKRSAKPLYAYLEPESGAGTQAYYLASPADRIFLHEGSYLDFKGVTQQAIFLGGVWEKLHIEVTTYKIREYKTAGDEIAYKEMTEANREMVTAIVDDIYETMVADIARDRKMEPAAIEKIIDDLPLIPGEYVRLGLVDGLKNLDEVLALFGSDVSAISARQYTGVEPHSLALNKGPKVAVVTALGGIVMEQGLDPMSFGEEQMIPDKTCADLEKAREDKNVQAIIFRVDSGGGSALASDLIGHCVDLAGREKPVIVSMGSVAGSGGYYIAAKASGIVAQPDTLTGSIGVVNIYVNADPLLKKLGINHTNLKRGRFADYTSMIDHQDEQSLAKSKFSVDNIYEIFTKWVAEGRGLEQDRVKEIGRGRVWTGKRARDIGLVDRLGGYDAAIALVNEKLGRDPDADVQLEYEQAAASLWEALMKMRKREALEESVPPGLREPLRALSPALAEPGAAMLIAPVITEAD